MLAAESGRRGSVPSHEQGCGAEGMRAALTAGDMQAAGLRFPNVADVPVQTGVHNWKFGGPVQRRVNPSDQIPGDGPILCQTTERAGAQHIKQEQNNKALHPRERTRGRTIGVFPSLARRRWLWGGHLQRQSYDFLGRLTTRHRGNGIFRTGGGWPDCSQYSALRMGVAHCARAGGRR